MSSVAGIPDDSTISITPPQEVDPRDLEIERLQRRLDEVMQQLLAARDAVVGAEAEKSVARARASELEHFLHVKTTEVEELTSKLLMLTEVSGRPIGGAAGTGRQRGGARRRFGRLASAIR